MTYRLRKGEPVADGVLRTAREQLAAALRQLGEPSPDGTGVAVHEARKHLKRSRAALRLLRAAVEPDTARRESRRLRDAGRVLAGLRDADVAVTTLEAALAEDAGAQARQQGARFHAWLLESRRRDSQCEREAMDRAGRMVSVALERADGWLAGPAGWSTVRVGLRRTYKRGRASMGDAYERADADGFHEWRKRVKDLWYQLSLLEPAWPAVIEPLGGQAHRLSELLGDEHDLSVLLESAGHWAGAGPGGAAALCGLLDRRRERLRGEARPLGRRLYAEAPRAFVDRVEGYWSAWRSESPSA